MIDGNAIGDVGNIVFVTARSCQKTGSLSWSLTVNQQREEDYFQSARAHPCFVYVKKSRDILRESCELVNQSVEDYLTQGSFDWGELKGLVRDNLSKFLFEQTKRRPAILPVVMEVK